MSINPLNDISQVYLEQVSVASRARNAVADDRLDAEQDKTNASMNRLRNQNNRFNRALASDAARKVERDVKKSSAYGPQHPKPGTVTGRRIEDPKPTGSKPKGYRIEETGAEKPNDGNLANNYPPYDKITRGDVIAGRLGKDEMGGKKKKKKEKNVKEGFSNWRQDLAEVIGDVADNKKIKERSDIQNNIKTSATSGGIKISEAVEEMGGTLLEMVEIDELDFIVESVYGELLDEGYVEDEIEEALEYALTEAKVTFGHDTATKPEKKRASLLAVAKQKLSGAKTAAKAAVARGARKVAKGALGVARKMEGGASKTTERKPSTYRGAGAGTKEKVSSGSYTPPTKKKAEKPADPWKGTATVPSKTKPKPKAEKPADPWKGSETTPPKAKAKPATTTTNQRKKKTSKLDALLSDIRNEQVQQINEMPYQVVGSPDGKKAKKIGKPVKSKKYADARAAELEDTHKKTGGKYRSEYVEEFQIDEKTLTKMEMKKREEIVRSMKDKEADFERRYPGRGREVMYATATKMAKKVVEQMLPTESPAVDNKKEMMDKQKIANMRMLQQKQQMLQKQKLQMQKAGKLPLE